jgi:hypothetical protein
MPDNQQTREELIALARRYLDTMASDADEAAELADFEKATAGRKVRYSLGMNGAVRASRHDGEPIRVPDALSAIVRAALEGEIPGLIEGACIALRQRHSMNFAAAAASITASLEGMKP